MRKRVHSSPRVRLLPFAIIFAGKFDGWGREGEGEGRTLRARSGGILARFFAVYRAIRLWGSLLRTLTPRRGACICVCVCACARVCVCEWVYGSMCARRKMQRREAREKGREGAARRRARWGTEVSEGTNAVGGCWRRNDYRPRTHSLPAIISSTNATKNIRRVSRNRAGPQGVPLLVHVRPRARRTRLRDV